MLEIKFTLIYAAVLAYMLIFLSVFTILRRRKKQVRFFGGNDAELEAAMRAQGNFTEYSPMFLILFLVLELNHFSVLLLNIFAGVFLLGRVCHAYSLLFHEKKGDFRFRVAAMTMTFVSIGALAKFCIFDFLF